MSDTATLTITINGSNDGPVATANVNSVTEDSDLSASGNLLTDNDGAGIDSDLDGDSLSVSGVDTSGANQYGTLTFHADGSYTYALDNNNSTVQALDDGETLTETYTYTVTDGDLSDTATLTITINGSNDGPVATANVNSVTEDGNLSASGNLLTDNDGAGIDSDLDGDSLSVSGEDTSGANQYGTLTFHADGSYTYALDNNNSTVQALDDGESLTEVYTYTVTDGDLSDTATLTITINGTDEPDEPVLIVGSNTSDTDQSTTPFEVSPETSSGAIEGGSANDILIGDTGGSSSAQGSQDYNIALVLDTSGSMSCDWSSYITAVKAYISSLSAYSSGTITLGIVTFADNATSARHLICPRRRVWWRPTTM